MLNNRYYKYLISLTFGGLSTLSFAPFYIFPIILISFVTILILIENCNSSKEAFFVGWYFGIGGFSTSLYWFANALLIESAKFAWLIPFANLGLPSLLALYFAVSFFITYIITKNLNGIYKSLAFSSNFILFEYLRSMLFTGFPWNLTGYSLGFSLELMQLASIGGIYFLSFMVLLLACSIYLLIKKTSYRFIVYIVLIYISSYIYGWNKLKAPTIFYEDVNILLVQGNISQENKWNEDLRFHNLSTYMDLSKNYSSEKYHIIWPESAIEYPIRDDNLLKYISKIIPENSFLISGSIRITNDQNYEKWWNSVSVIGADGKIISSYDKSHLVPFGEYIPLRSIMPRALEKLTYGIGDFSEGKGPQTLNVDLIPPFGPLICYEALFPNNIIDFNKRPEWILNLTNDAWFGKSIGPKQHFQMVRLRAIEQNLPLIRVANTGISAVIDNKGRIIKMLNLGEKGNIYSSLPKSDGSVTIYSRYGNILIFTIISLIYIFLYINKFLYKKKK